MKYYLLMLFFGLSQGLSAHDFHVCVVDIDIQDNGIEITIKTFLDDLQEAIGLKPGQELPAGYSSSDELISTYLKDKIIAVIDGKGLEFILQSVDASTEAVWITVQIKDIDPTARKLTLTNTFLTEIYNDQTNIVNIKKNGKKKVYALSNKKTSISHTF